MKPSVSFITLGVDDLERSMRFYRDGLGLPTKGIVDAEHDEGGVVFFELGGVVLGLWPRTSLARDANLPPGPPSATEFSLAHNVGSREEVGALMEEARRAGAAIVKEAGETFWGGYSGYFQDPDGHLWEAAWNPEYTPPE